MRRVSAALAALHLAILPAGAAEGWVFQAGETGGGSTGFAVDGGFRGLWFTCGPSGATLFIATDNTALQAGVDQTAVVSVDGTAFVQRMRASPAGGNGPTLSRALSAAELRDLASRLAKGKTAEVSMPAGRFALPLKGSGKAVQSFVAACR